MLLNKSMMNEFHTCKIYKDLNKVKSDLRYCLYLFVFETCRDGIIDILVVVVDRWIDSVFWFGLSFGILFFWDSVFYEAKLQIDESWVMYSTHKTDIIFMWRW